MRLIDTSDKIETLREAKAYGKIKLSKNIIEKIKNKEIEKGDLIEATKIAGIYGAKNTSNILPFCHPIPIDFIETSLELFEDYIEVYATVRGIARTGYEMEALSSVNAMLLNIYDMCKAFKEEMTILEVKLLSKKGGKDNFSDLEGEKAAVIVLSDRAYRGEYEDKSGKVAIDILKSLKAEVVDYRVLPDDKELLKNSILELKDKVNIIITSGGTGFSKKDITPEVTESLITKRMIGFEEVMRVYGYRKLPRSIMSRAVCGVLNENCVIINLPGSTGGVKDNLTMIGGLIKHALKMARGESH